MKTSTKIITAAFIIAVAALYVIIYVIPGVSDALTPTEVIGYGNLRIGDDEECYIARSEQLYTAGSGGNVNYYIEDGVKVRKGANVLDVGGAVYTAGSNGVVSYYYDGCEGIFSPDTMRSLTPEQIAGVGMAPRNAVTGYASPGAVLFKITDNSKWYVISWIEPGLISKYQVGKAVTIEFPDGESVDARVEDIIDNGESWLTIMSTTMYYSGFAKERRIDARIITSDCSGIMIPNASITSKDGMPGVYVKQKNGDYAFTPIKVIASDGENSIAEESFFYDADGKRVSTVGVYDEILRDPDVPETQTAPEDETPDEEAGADGPAPADEQLAETAAE